MPEVQARHRPLSLVNWLRGRSTQMFSADERTTLGLTDEEIALWEHAVRMDERAADLRLALDDLALQGPDDDLQRHLTEGGLAESDSRSALDFLSRARTGRVQASVEQLRRQVEFAAERARDAFAHRAVAISLLEKMRPR